MTHPLVTHEMVEKAIDVCERTGFSGRSMDMRAALEAVADDIRNQAIEELERKLIDYSDQGAMCAGFVRTLKSKP